MKKYLLSFAVLLMGVTTFTSCSDDDDDVKPVELKTVTNAVYVVNAGQQKSGVTGSLTRFDVDAWTATDGVFRQVNGRNLGVTANDAVIYGTKMYIVVDGEGTVEVVDKNTLKSVKTIKLTQQLGAATGTSPRQAVAAHGCVYVTTFGVESGAVAAIDTTNFSLKKVYKGGSYPDGIACVGNKLYVCNSNYGGGKGNLSVIDITTGDTTMIVNTHLTNPTTIAAVASDIYVLHFGTFAPVTYDQTGAGVMKLSGKTVTKVVDATMMAVNDKKGAEKIYTINAPWTTPATPVTYNVYDVRSGKVSTFTTKMVDAPSAMAVDPVTGYVYILSYKKNPDTGYADYEGPGYANVYDASGNLLHTLNVGVGPTSMVFDYKDIPVHN